MITALMLYICTDAFHTDCQVWRAKLWEEAQPGQCQAAARVLEVQEQRKAENKGKYVFTVCEPEPGSYKQSSRSTQTQTFVI